MEVYKINGAAIFFTFRLAQSEVNLIETSSHWKKSR